MQSYKNESYVNGVVPISQIASGLGCPEVIVVHRRVDVTFGTEKIEVLTEKKWKSAILGNRTDKQ